MYVCIHVFIFSKTFQPPLRTPFGPNPYGMPNIPSAGGSGPSSSGLSRPTGNIGSAGTGLTAFNSAASSGAGLNKPGGGVGFGSLGSNTPGFGMTLGGGRTSGSDSALLNPGKPGEGDISLHLLQLVHKSFLLMHFFLCLVYSTDKQPSAGAASLFSYILRDFKTCSLYKKLMYELFENFNVIFDMNIINCY